MIWDALWHTCDFKNHVAESISHDQFKCHQNEKEDYMIECCWFRRAQEKSIIVSINRYTYNEKVHSKVRHRRG